MHIRERRRAQGLEFKGLPSPKPKPQARVHKRPRKSQRLGTQKLQRLKAVGRVHNG